MVGRYIDLPGSFFRLEKFSIFNLFYFAEFLGYYYLVSKNESKEYQYQPEEPAGTVVDTGRS